MPVDRGHGLAGENQSRRLVVQLQDDLPGFRHFVGVGRAQHDQARDGPQRRQLLDGLVRRAVLADADGVVREDVDHRQLHQGG